MKLRLILVTVIAMTVGMACEKKVKLDNDMQKSSYALGQQIGQNIKNQGIEVDVDAMAAAIKDTTKGEKPKLTQEEVQQALMKLQEAAIKKQSQVAEENKKKGQEFLDKNKAAEGVKTTASGLQYKVEKEGDGKTPTLKDTVVAHYTGTLIDGTKFDSSVDRGQPAEFPVSGVIPGWTEALQLMKVGSKYKLFIPAELAYGANGRPGIPPNSVLLFDVELIGIKEAPAAAPAGDKKPVDKKEAKAKKK